MAVNSFIPTIWSARILQNLHKELVFGNVVNREYEGEIANQGDTVKIGGIGPVSVSNYTKNSTTVSWQTLQDASQVLVVDQVKYFAFKVDDVDQAQTKPKLMDEAMREAGYAIADAIDQFVASMYSQASSSNVIGGDASSAKTVGTGSGETDAYEQLVDLGVALDEANVSKAGRWAVLPPWYDGMLRKGNTYMANAASPAGASTLVNGYLGNVAGFNLYTSNNVTTDNAATPTYRVMFGTNAAISLAVQKALQPEAIRLQDSFSDGVRGLVLYGGKVVRPAALGVLYAKKGT